MFHTIIYNDKNKTLDEIVNINYDQYRKKYVKVVVVNKDNQFWFDTMIDYIEKSDVFDLQIVENHLSYDPENEEEILNSAQDTLTILNNYVNNVSSKVDKGKLQELFRELYHEANLTQV